jgi:hypothetical protein
MRQRTRVPIGLAGPLCAAVMASGCSDPHGESPTTLAASPAPTTTDGRLVPVIAELEAHPEWTGGGREFAVRSTLPSLREVCVAVASDTADLQVMVDVDATPWKVQAVAILDDETGFRVTHEVDDAAGNGELCKFVLTATERAVPQDPAEVEVSGPVNPAQAQAIRLAMHGAPERFGITAEGMPSINVQPAAASPDGLECFEGVVYVGGPGPRR